MIPKIALIALCASTCFARLGENASQIEARYGVGKPADSDVPGAKAVYYSAKGFSITVLYLDGKSQGETYGNMFSHELADEQVTAMLAANGSGWKNTGSEGGAGIYKTEGKVAIVDRLRGILRVETDAITDLRVKDKAAKDAAEKARLDIF